MRGVANHRSLRKRKGALSKIEFRLGVREDVGLRSASNALIDAYFGKFDVDAGI